jgi:hypothetical protein
MSLNAPLPGEKATMTAVPELDTEVEGAAFMAAMQAQGGR